MYAVRNVKLCTKDCLCLFVCPTGATDTENGQIDKEKCIGCRQCVDACPSHAISMIFETYPQPKRKDPELAGKMRALLETKALQEASARAIADDDSADPGARRLARALARSCRILGEDCAREANYMIPQAEAVGELLDSLGIELDRDQYV